MNETAEQTTYKTDTLRLAAYLCVCGYDYTCAKTEGMEPKAVFTFYDTDGKIKVHVTEYMTENVVLHLPAYNKTVKRMLREVHKIMGSAR